MKTWKEGGTKQVEAQQRKLDELRKYEITATREKGEGWAR